jgi:hypothetical protein
VVVDPRSVLWLSALRGGPHPWSEGQTPRGRHFANASLSVSSNQYPSQPPHSLPHPTAPLTHSADKIDARVCVLPSHHSGFTPRRGEGVAHIAVSSSRPQPCKHSTMPRRQPIAMCTTMLGDIARTYSSPLGGGRGRGTIIAAGLGRCLHCCDVFLIASPVPSPLSP